MIRLEEIVLRLGGKLVGDPRREVAGVASLSGASSGDITFYLDSTPVSALLSTNAAVVITKNIRQDIAEKSQVVTENPHFYFVQLINEFFPVDSAPRPAGVDSRAFIGVDVVLGRGVTVAPHAVVSDRVQLGDNVFIGAGCVIGEGVQIKSGSQVFPNSTIYAGVKLGEHAIIHSGAVLGGDGFGFVSEAGRWYKVPQIGSLVVGDDVEIGCNTTIDRGALDDTEIGNGVKIDNQVQIGHNCVIGENTVVAGCVGIAGSVRIGKRCKIGGAAMITGHLDIADDVTVSAGSLVAGSIRAAGRYTGVYPLGLHAEWLRSAVELRKLGRNKGESGKHNFDQ
jgi:UDP-3-O-[3-hydroxymyristoyl] glucosamine N-acyltransferase